MEKASGEDKPQRSIFVIAFRKWQPQVAMRAKHPSFPLRLKERIGFFA
jgi:hypothetical protein